MIPSLVWFVGPKPHTHKLRRSGGKMEGQSFAPSRPDPLLFKRLRIEAEQELLSKDEFIKLNCVNDTDLQNWIASIRGPPNSCYSGYIFDVEIRVPNDYPHLPPTMRFITKIFHPNVHFVTGEVCIDILKTDWTPSWSLQSACRAIQSILSDPNADSPLNCDAGNMLRASDHLSFHQMAKMYCVEYATPLPINLEKVGEKNGGAKIKLGESAR